MGMKVDWKLIESAEKNGLIYWLSGWRNKKKRERFVILGYFNQADGAWVDTDLDEPLTPPTHFAEHFTPDPPQ